MSSNKRRKLNIFNEDGPSSTYYNSINNYDEFILMKKSSGNLNLSNILSLDAKKEEKENAIMEYSSQDGNYDEYPDLFGMNEMNGNQVIDFGINEIPNSSNQHLIEYEWIDFKEYIGEGNFSDVWSARIDGEIDALEEDDVLVAVKVLKPMKQGINVSLESFMNELEILRKINQDENPYVLKLIGYCKSPQMCIITELMDMSLYDLIHDESKSKSKSKYLDNLKNQIKMALYIAKGIQGINERSNILHNDLTSKNILLKKTSDSHDNVDYEVKITDFGLSCFLERNSFPSKRANARWRSPEQTKSNIFSKKGEVWSFGVIFWEILTLQLPYPSIKEPKLVAEKVADNSLALDIPKTLPDVLGHLLSDCLIYDPDKRTSIDVVVSTLERFYQNLILEKI